MAQATLLSDRSAIELSGPAARDFLQGLVTNDMTPLEPGKAAYTALLTPQGKILFDFFVVATATERFLLDVARATAADLAKRLALYRLRAKVDIAERPEFAVAALWDGERPIPEAAVAYADPRHPALGMRLIGPRAALQDFSTEPESAYRRRRLNLGVPDSADLPPDTVFALDAGFEELSGVSFRKGCYVGQEVTARMKHRATARRRFLIAETASPVAPGTPIEASGREIGTLATGEGGLALALIRLDRFAEAEAAHVPLAAAGTPVTLRRPDWLRV